MFRNLTAYWLQPEGIPSTDTLAKALTTMPLRTPGPLELATSGFVSPFGRDSDFPTLRLDSHTLLTFATWSRLLPAQVVNDAVEEQLAKIEAERGRRPGGKERRMIREEVLTDLLPRAFLKSRLTNVWLDHSAGMLVIDSASNNVCDSVVSRLRDGLGSLPATPLAAATTTTGVRIMLTRLITEGVEGVDLHAGEEVELRDMAEDGAVIRARRQDLDTEEMREHYSAGKYASQLALRDDRVAFTLDDRLVLRKFRYSDVVIDTMPTNIDDRADELAARFALFTAEARRVFAQLGQLFDLDPNALHLDGDRA